MVNDLYESSCNHTKNHSGGGALHRLATLVGHTPAKENAEGQALILSNTSMSPYTTLYRLPHHIHTAAGFYFRGIIIGIGQPKMHQP